MSDVVSYQLEGNIAVITVNNPPVNALFDSRPARFGRLLHPIRERRPSQSSGFDL